MTETVSNFFTCRACIVCILSALAVLAACNNTAPGPGKTPSAAARLTGAGDDWPGVGGAADESNYSRLAQVTRDNISRLGLAWYLDLPGEVSLEATPVAVDGVLYFSGNYSVVYAVDAASGELLWRHDPEIWQHDPERMALQFMVSRGVAYAGGRIFAATFDGRLQALDAETGKLLWSVDTLAPGTMQFITGAPRAFNDKVVIGNGGGDFGSRGYATAYYQATGEQAWRFYTVPGSPEENAGDPAMERAAATWGGEYWKTGTGGGPWNAFTFDPGFNLVFIGTGNGGPMDPELRSPGDGDNLYLASIVAVDADSGEYRWHYQVNPREPWDYKATADMISATLEIGGASREVLMQLPTNGFFYLLDRETGALISAEKSGKVTWAERIDLATGRPVENPGMRYRSGESLVWPSTLGMHSWKPMAYSPDTGLVYIPYTQAGVRISRGTTVEGDVSIGGLNLGWAFEDEEDGTASLLAWDPVAQKAAWKVPVDSFWNGGTLATAGGLVFQGTGSGRVNAHDADTGERLWSFDAGLGIIGAPIAYAVDGRQYLSILVGYGGAASIGSNLMNEGWQYGAQPRRLLTFALDAGGELPPAAPRDTAITPLDDPALVLREQDVEAGRLLYITNFCLACHGRDLVSGGTAPDLRASPVALHPDAFWSVVHDGSLMSRGMPRFERLTREEARQLQAYIRAGAREALGLRDAGAAKSGGGRM